MATPGSPWIVNKTQIVQALKEQKGRLTYVARFFNVDYKTLRKKIDEDSELTELVSDLRNDFENTILDKAESCVLNAIDSSDLNNSLKSAFYVLNSKGKVRGWTNTLTESQMAPSQIDLENRDIEIKALKAKIEEFERQSKAS